MIESIMGINYGKTIVETIYKEGTPAFEHNTTTTSVHITNRKQLMDTIFDELGKLKDSKSVAFEVFADKHTHEPCRVEVTKRVTIDLD